MRIMIRLPTIGGAFILLSALACCNSPKREMISGSFVVGKIDGIKAKDCESSRIDFNHSFIEFSDVKANYIVVGSFIHLYNTVSDLSLLKLASPAPAALVARINCINRSDAVIRKILLNSIHIIQIAGPKKSFLIKDADGSSVEIWHLERSLHKAADHQYNP